MGKRKAHQNGEESVMTVLLSLAFTILVYVLCKKIYQHVHITILSPVLSSFIVITLFLLLFHVSYGTYMSGGKYLTDALEPATVAFAIPLYRHFQLFRKHAATILLSLTTGSVLAMLSSVWMAKWLHLGNFIIRSVAPRSVTTPIAMDVSHSIGGVPVLTAVFVILTGILGLVVGPALIRLFKIRSSIGKGTLMGMGAHGIGTARAFEDGQSEGTIASLSMVIAGCITIVLAPFLMHVFA